MNNASGVLKIKLLFEKAQISSDNWKKKQQERLKALKLFLFNSQSE